MGLAEEISSSRVNHRPSPRRTDLQGGLKEPRQLLPEYAAKSQQKTKAVKGSNASANKKNIKPFKKPNKKTSDRKKRAKRPITKTGTSPKCGSKPIKKENPAKLSVMPGDLGQESSANQVKINTVDEIAKSVASDTASYVPLYPTLGPAQPGGVEIGDDVAAKELEDDKSLQPKEQLGQPKVLEATEPPKPQPASVTGQPNENATPSDRELKEAVAPNRDSPPKGPSTARKLMPMLLIAYGLFGIGFSISILGLFYMGGLDSNSVLGPIMTGMTGYTRYIGAFIIGSSILSILIGYRLFSAKTMNVMSGSAPENP